MIKVKKSKIIDGKSPKMTKTTVIPTTTVTPTSSPKVTKITITPVKAIPKLPAVPDMPFKLTRLQLSVIISAVVFNIILGTVMLVLLKVNDVFERARYDLARQCYGSSPFLSDKQHFINKCYMMTDRYFRNCEPVYCRRVEYAKTAHGFIDLVPLSFNNTAHIFLPVERDQCDLSELGFEIGTCQPAVSRPLMCRRPISAKSIAGRPPKAFEPTWIDNCGVPDTCLMRSMTINNNLKVLLENVSVGFLQCPGSDRSNPKVHNDNCDGNDRLVLLRARFLRCQFDAFHGGKYCTGPPMRIEICERCPKFDLNETVATLCKQDKPSTFKQYECTVTCPNGQTKQLANGAPCSLGAGGTSNKTFCFFSQCLFAHEISAHIPDAHCSKSRRLV